MLKIAMITRFLPPHVDGVGDYTYRLSYALAQTSIQVSLWTSVNQAVGVTPAHVLVHPVVKTWGWSGALRLASLIRRNRPDVINLQYVPQMYNRYGINFGVASLPLILRVCTGRPVITTLHELIGFKISSLKGMVLGLLSVIQTAILLLGSSKVIVPVERQEELLRRGYPLASKNIVRIPVGASVLPAPSEKIPAAKDSGCLTLGTFGSGQRWWQYEVAFHLLRELLNQQLRIKLLCIGDLEGTNPAYHSHLKQLAETLGLSDSIQWTGRISPEEISRHLSSVDVFLALHRTGITARSTAVISALAHGLPVVTTKGPDADQWLLQSSAMLFVEPDDFEGALKVVGDLLKKPLLRLELGLRAKSFYQKNLSWNMIGQRFLEVVGSTMTPAHVR